jgi:hypothetical protein
MQEVTGSIPVISTKKHRIWFRYGAFLFVAYGGNDDHYGLWERLFAVWWVECWVQNDASIVPYKLVAMFIADFKGNTA